MYAFFLLIFHTLTSAAVLAHIPDNQEASYIACARCIAAQASGYTIGCTK